MSLKHVFAMFAGTIICYGQTGAGKTYTMTGATENYKHRGILPRALQQVGMGPVGGMPYRCPVSAADAAKAVTSGPQQDCCEAGPRVGRRRTRGGVKGISRQGFTLYHTHPEPVSCPAGL